MSSFETTDFLNDVLEPLLPYIEKSGAVEVTVNDPCRVRLEIPGQEKRSVEDPKLTLEYFQRLGRVLSNRRDIRDFERTPFLAAWLPGGHRLQLCLGNSVTSGVAASVRVWRPRAFSLADYRLSARRLGLIDTAIAGKWNILVCGGMFSGKTTLTNALIERLPVCERVISIEDTPELDLSHIGDRVQFIVDRLATTEDIDYVQVLRAVMRLRPDRTLIGELSDQNTYLLSRILNMGHGGTIATLHADSPELAFAALKTNITLAGIQGDAADSVFRHNIDLIVQVERLPNYDRVVTDLYVSPARKAKLVRHIVFEAPLITSDQILEALREKGIFATDEELTRILSSLSLATPDQRIGRLLYSFEGCAEKMNPEQRKAVVRGFSSAGPDKLL